MSKKWILFAPTLVSNQSDSKNSRAQRRILKNEPRSQKRQKLMMSRSRSRKSRRRRLKRRKRRRNRCLKTMVSWFYFLSKLHQHFRGWGMFENKFYLLPHSCSWIPRFAPPLGHCQHQWPSKTGTLTTTSGTVLTYVSFMNFGYETEKKVHFRNVYFVERQKKCRG